jgi:hypothetical protein
MLLVDIEYSGQIFPKDHFLPRFSPVWYFVVLIPEHVFEGGTKVFISRCEVPIPITRERLFKNFFKHHFVVFYHALPLSFAAHGWTDAITPALDSVLP